jgi:hypothetical protein
LRRSPATNHGEIEGEKGTSVFRGMGRVDERWKQPTGSTTATACSSPADGVFGRWWISTERAAAAKLMRGLERLVENMIFGKIWEAGMHGPG